MVDFARCAGVFPSGKPCQFRDACVRFQATEGDNWLRPKVDEDERCHDLRTPLGQRMIEGMMEGKQ